MRKTVGYQGFKTTANERSETIAQTLVVCPASFMACIRISLQGTGTYCREERLACETLLSPVTSENEVGSFALYATNASGGDFATTWAIIISLRATSDPDSCDEHTISKAEAQTDDNLTRPSPPALAEHRHFEASFQVEGTGRASE